MKAYILPSALLLFSVVLFSCKPSGKTAAQYNNTIVKHQVKIGALQQELFTVFKDGKSGEMKQVLDRFKNEVNSITDSVASMAEFDGRDDFKKETLKYFDELKHIAENECSSIVKLYEIPDSLYTDAEEKKVQDLRTAINEKTKTALKKLEDVQKKFAKEYNFEVGQ